MIPLIILVILFNSILSISGQQQTIPGQALPLSPEPGSSAAALSNKVASLKSSQESSRNQLQAIEQAKQLALQRVGQLGSDQTRQQALETSSKVRSIRNTEESGDPSSTASSTTSRVWTVLHSKLPRFKLNSQDKYLIYHSWDNHLILSNSKLTYKTWFRSKVRQK